MNTSMSSAQSNDEHGHKLFIQRPLNYQQILQERKWPCFKIQFYIKFQHNIPQETNRNSVAAHDLLSRSKSTVYKFLCMGGGGIWRQMAAYRGLRLQCKIIIIKIIIIIYNKIIKIIIYI